MDLEGSGPQVTWIMTIQNGMPYLPYALLSIAVQSYRNAQILVRDDGSTDGTLEELQRWIPGRIPGRIVSGPALGVALSLAFLVEHATTEFCARMDADDICHPDRLRKQVEHIMTRPAVSALGSWVSIIDDSGIGTEEIWEYPVEDALVRWRSRWIAGLNHPSVLFRRSRVLAAGNYANVRSEDGELWIRLSSTGEIYNLPEPLLLYRRFKASKTGKFSDFYQGQLAAAKHAAAHLFPGVPREDAVELWQVTHPNKIETSGPVKIKHLLQLASSAKALARLCGKPENYFQSTWLYRDQMYWLKRKLLTRYGLVRLMDLRHSLFAKDVSKYSRSKILEE
jgi:glycosyltransferase involved in cell wall biosynthesis